MKLRTGFVSNSSSSSFVLIGYMVDAEHYSEDLYDEVDEIAGSKGFECLFGSDDGLSDGQVAVGNLYTMNTEYCDTSTADLQAIIKDVEEVPKHIKVKGGLKLIAGIRAS